jgi:hypothetical protein
VVMMRRVFALSCVHKKYFLLSEILGLLHARSLNDEDDGNYALSPTNNNQPFSTSNYVMVVIEWGVGGKCFLRATKVWRI